MKRVRLVLLAFAFGLLVPGVARAEVYCNGTLVCTGYGEGFIRGMNENVLPDMMRGAAEGAVLAAIQAAPMSLQAPDNFAFGFQLSAGFGPDRDFDDGNPFLHGDSNIQYRSYPFALPAQGRSLDSSFYAIVPGTLFGLSKSDTFALHVGFHSLSYSGETGLDLFDPVASSDGGGGRLRARNFGVRYSHALLDSRGAEFFGWLGLRFATGLSWSQSHSDLRGSYETRDFIDANSFGTDLSVASFAALKTVEYQQTTIIDSRTLVLPVELRTGVQVLFLSLEIAPGVALNYGRHEVEASIEGQLCSGPLGNCSGRSVRESFYESLAPGASAAFSAVTAGDPPPFIANSRAEIRSRSVIPYLSLAARVHMFALNIVVQATSSSEQTAASVGLEATL
ncbi:MAG: hypothetical protein H7A21_13100 [Spirochaetales bacterium]|nr:hypothetical protein [Leptospiraceae bacterium]MCP5482366.1 hypothetical protein [Spirochaetales bacterium]MCP5484195.1 hypothetical protein [Spirochaetales bacterium]